MTDFDTLYEGHDFTTIKLPNGGDFLMSVRYTPRETSGVLALVITSSLSCLAILGLLVAISLSAFNTRTVAAKEHLFVRTHVAAYFICLLMCDLLQTIGSLMNIEWIMEKMVSMNTFCQVQGGIKQAADVGVAIWSFIIAIHTFNVLFLQLEVHKYVLYASLVGGWSAIGAFVLAGPANRVTLQRGPFFGISGYWCWISSSYPTERITLDYMIMFMSAFFCFILYALVILRLRGNILVHGGRVNFRLNLRPTSWRDDAPSDNYTKSVARRMLLYPVAYTALILPIAACRFHSWSGHTIPFEATIFSAVVYLLSGLVNVILFSTTRRILPPRSIFKLAISSPKLQATTTDLPPSPTLEKAMSGSSISQSTLTVPTPSLNRPSGVPVMNEPPMLRRVDTNGSDTSDLGPLVRHASSPLDFGGGGVVYTPNAPSSTSIPHGVASSAYTPSLASIDLESPTPQHFGGLSLPSLSRATSAGGWSPSQESVPPLGEGGLRPNSAMTVASMYSQTDSVTWSGRDSLTDEYARLYRSDTIVHNRAGNESSR